MINPDHIGFLLTGLYRLLSNAITGLTLLKPNKSNHVVPQSFTWVWVCACPKTDTALYLVPPSSHFAPINNRACVALWCLRRKELRLEHPISKPTKPTQPVTVDYLELPLAPPHHHPLFHITCWFAPPPYLHFYWPIISLSPQSVWEQGAH